MRRLQRLLAGCRYVSWQLWAIALVLPMMQPAWGNEFPGIKQAQRGFSTSAVDLLAQQQGNVAVTEVTGVKVNSTSTGIEVILQTSIAEALQVLNKSDANSFIAEIPNAQLRLPQGNFFQQEKPFAGIAEITVINLDANSIRITVKGEGGIPKVELFNSDEGLIFGFTPTTTTSQQPQTQPETPTNQTQPETPTPEADQPIELVVTGEQDGYRAPDASTATKVDTDRRDIPQSIQVVPQQILKDQQVTRLGEGLKNVPGVVRGNQSSRSPFDAYLIRGFADFNFLRNGLLDNAVNFSIGTDSANIERLEVLKGPSSVLYGPGGGGGLISILTKQPLTEPYYSVEGSAGSFDFYRGTIDFSGPLNDSKTVLYRFNAAAQTSGSFIDFFESERYLVAPVLSWQISDRTKLTLEAEYLYAAQPFDQGIPAVGSVLPNPNGKIPRSRYVGEPSDTDIRQAYRIGYNFEHSFSKNWEVRSAFQGSFFLRNTPTHVYSLGVLNDRTISRTFQAANDYYNIYNLDNYIVGRFATGSIQHQLVTGFNLSRTETLFSSFTRSAAPLDLFNPVYGQPLGSPSDPSKNLTTQDQLGIYIQDQITLAENLKLLLGGRFDIASQKGEDFIASTSSFQQDEAFSPRFGIVYQPIKPISLYASYSRGFEQNVGRSFDNTVFQPERTTQYEVGVKADLSERLSATLAFYDLTRSNVQTTDPRNPNFSIQTGEQNSQGIELDVSGEILPGWNIFAGYAYTNATITKDNTFAVGNRLNNVPEHSLNLWTTYEIQSGNFKGLGFSLGLFYIGDRQGDLDNTFTVPSYLRTDAAIFYNQGGFRAAVNVRNLFDVDYFESSQSQTRVFPGDPLTVVGSISWGF